MVMESASFAVGPVILISEESEIMSNVQRIVKSNLKLDSAVETRITNHAYGRR